MGYECCKSINNGSFVVLQQSDTEIEATSYKSAVVILLGGESQGNSNLHSVIKLNWPVPPPHRGVVRRKWPVGNCPELLGGSLTAINVLAIALWFRLWTCFWGEAFSCALYCVVLSLIPYVFFFSCWPRMRNTGTGGTRTMRQQSAHGMPAA